MINMYEIEYLCVGQKGVNLNFNEENIKNYHTFKYLGWLVHIISNYLRNTETKIAR